MYELLYMYEPIDQFSKFNHFYAQKEFISNFTS